MTEGLTPIVGQPERRLKFVSLKVEPPRGKECTVEVTLERETGRTVVCRHTGARSKLGIALSSACATAAGLGEATGVGPDAFEIVDLKEVTLTERAGIIVAITTRNRRGKFQLAGFCFIDPQRPAHAGALAVLHGTNRLLSAFLLEDAEPPEAPSPPSGSSASSRDR